MATFTDITTAGANVFSVNVSNEIRTSFIEHQLVADVVPVSLFSVGDDAHAVDTWAGMQAGIIDICTSFIDYSLETGGNFEGQANLPMFDVGQFYFVAGIASGFRRATSWDYDNDDWTDYNDDMFGYGTAEVGDIMGPWIWVDLQKALDALRYTKSTISSSTAQTSDRLAQSNGNYDTARTACASAWDALGYTNTSSASIASCYASVFLLYNYRWGMMRERMAGFSVSAPTTLVPSSLDVYIKLLNRGTLTFADLDSYGVSANQIALQEIIASSNTASRAISAIGGGDTNPNTLITFPPATGGQGYDVRTGEICWKWDFTYSL